MVYYRGCVCMWVCALRYCDYVQCIRFVAWNRWICWRSVQWHGWLLTKLNCMEWRDGNDGSGQQPWRWSTHCCALSKISHTSKLLCKWMSILFYLILIGKWIKCEGSNARLIDLTADICMNLRMSEPACKQATKWMSSPISQSACIRAYDIHSKDFYSFYLDNSIYSDTWMRRLLEKNSSLFSTSLQHHGAPVLFFGRLITHE